MSAIAYKGHYGRQSRPGRGITPSLLKSGFGNELIQLCASFLPLRLSSSKTSLASTVFPARLRAGEFRLRLGDNGV